MKTPAVNSSFSELTSAPEGRRLLEQEALLVSATELVARLMEEKKVNRAELARRIGKSKAFVTQTLRGPHNMTLRTLADLACALGSRVRLRPASWIREGAQAFPATPLHAWVSIERQLRRGMLRRSAPQRLPGIPAGRKARLARERKTKR